MARKYNRRYRRKPKTFLQKALPVAKTALRVAKYAAGVINAEYKKQIVSAALSAITWSGSITTLCNPAQGNGASQRSGDSIKVKDLMFQGEWNRNVLGLTTEVCRLIIFWDKMNQTTVVSDLLQNTGTYGSIYSDKNEDNRYNTKILLDKKFIVNNQNSQQKLFKYMIKINKHVNFQSGTTTIKTGALKFAVMTQSATNGSQFSYISRVSYVDN